MSAVGSMNMRMVAADTTTGKAADTITTMKKVAAGITTMVTRMVAASTIMVMGKVAVVKAADITIALSDSGANILSAATQVGGQGVVRMRFLVAISDASLLDTLLATVARVPSVYDARRIMPGEGANQMKRRKG